MNYLTFSPAKRAVKAIVFMFNPAAKGKCGVNGGISTVLLENFIAVLLRNVTNVIGNVVKMKSNVAIAIGNVANPLSNVTEMIGNVTKTPGNVANMTGNAINFLRNVSKPLSNVSDTLKFMFMFFGR